MDFEVEEVEPNGCSGWRFPKDCPHDGKFDRQSKACEECVKDALEAIWEVFLRDFKEVTDAT